MMTDDRKRVLILGAGFAGLHTALQLEKTLVQDAAVEITLVDQNHSHLFTPLLHEAACGVCLSSPAGRLPWRWPRPLLASEPVSGEGDLLG